MSDDPLDRRATAARLEALFEGGVIDERTLVRAVERASRTPEREAWRRFLSTVLLLVGSALVLSGLVYLVAFNWSELHRFAQLGLCGAWIVVGVAIGYLRLPDLVGKVGVLGASVGVGALLAVIGQTYQTGADQWGLFATWAVLVVPFTLVARMPAQWVLFVVLLDVTLATWGVQVVPHWGGVRWLLFSGLNGVVALAWPTVAGRWPELRSSWAPRVLAASAFVGLWIPALPTAALFRWGLTDVGTWATVVLTAASVALWVRAQQSERPDLFPSTLAATSLLLVVDTVLGRFLFEDLDLEELGLFVLSAAVLVQAALYLTWAVRQRPRVEGES